MDAGVREVVGQEMRVKTEEGGTERQPSALAKLLAEAYREMARRPGGMSSGMKESVVSLIYKEKGFRHDLKFYRPIAVSSILYRVLAKTLVIALRPLLPQVVDTCQTAFQQDLFLSDNTR